MFYCPIAGMCLSMPEQRKLLKRCGARIKGVQNYAVHVTVIDALKQESGISKRFERLVNRRYRREIAEWDAIKPEDWLEFFHQSLTPSSAGALVWFSALYRDLSKSQEVDVYGTVHMLMHAEFLKQADLQIQVTRAKSQLKGMQEKYRALQTQRHHERQLFRQLEQSHSLQQKNVLALHDEIGRLKQAASPEGLRDESEVLRQKLQRTEGKLHARATIIEDLKAEREDIRQQLAEHQSFAENMRTELAELFEHLTQAASEAHHCPNYALCNRRILIVGGMTKLRSFYEEIVVKMGGQFEYHDGYTFSGHKPLTALVDRSDVVICPVDVNSHSACLHVKKCCKELKKPYYMLRNSSISSIHQTLTEVAAISN
jgi:hypothetical protein